MPHIFNGAAWVYIDLALDATHGARGDTCQALDEALGPLIERTLRRYVSPADAKMARRETVERLADRVVGAT